MKKLFRVLLIIVSVVAFLIVALLLLLVWASNQPAVKDNYFENVQTEKTLEQQYINKGAYEVSYIQFDASSDKIGQYKIWYPTIMEYSNGKYPLVVMANGTGVKASRYEPIFDHLASWGFIVVGNEDDSSWDGFSSSKSLDFMLECNDDPTSVFYKKIDIENIGIAGHSQGGVGAINAVVNQDNGRFYKTIYTASTTHISLAEALKWPYDVSKIKIPYFMTAGTLKTDAGDENDYGIAPLSSLQENYAKLPDYILKIYARRVDTDHGDMLVNADGYMTAWFRYQLKGDEQAGKIFIGDNAEILSNSNWQDVTKNR